MTYRRSHRASQAVRRSAGTVAGATRRILVVGSQCEQLGRLDALPAAAEELFEVMTDPLLGACDRQESVLLIDSPTRETHDRIADVFASASRDQVTLILAFIGHGVSVGRDFYFLPLDASPEPTSQTAVNVAETIKELQRAHSFVDGLVVLIDACHSGTGAKSAAASWAEPEDTGFRFEVLTSTSHDVAMDACFTRELVEGIKSGFSDIASQYVRCEDISEAIEVLCSPQEPEHFARRPDRGLFLARNVRADSRNPLLGSGAHNHVLELTEAFRVTSQLEKIIALSGSERLLVVLGDAGSGKSALVAALAYPAVAAGAVPNGFVQAVAFLSDSTHPEGLLTGLQRQLIGTVPDFQEAVEEYEDSFRPARDSDWKDPDRYLAGPLRKLGELRRRHTRDLGTVRIVVDGMDELNAESVIQIQSILETLGRQAELSHVRVIVTTRSGKTRMLRNAEVHPLERSSVEEISSYFEKRGVDADAIPRLARQANGNWLDARLLADLANAGSPIDVSSRSDLYNALLQPIVEAVGTELWERREAVVLGVLSAAGLGPALPFPLLNAASSTLGGPAGRAPIRDALANLEQLVVREQPGTGDETVGVFHDTFAAHFLDARTCPYGVAASDVHSALITTIERMAPPGPINGDPVRRYAAMALPEHLWTLGEFERAIDAVDRYDPPREARVARLQAWQARAEEELGQEHTVVRVISRRNEERSLGQRVLKEPARGSLTPVTSSLRGQSEQPVGRKDPSKDVSHWTWLHSDRPLPRRFIRPLMHFVRVAGSMGIYMLVAAFTALIWANSPFGQTYPQLWTTPLDGALRPFEWSIDLRTLVNGGVMTFFFLYVGTALKRELVGGALREVRVSSLALVGGLGGVLASALIFLLIAAPEVRPAWIASTLSDTAVALATLSLLPWTTRAQGKPLLLGLAGAHYVGSWVLLSLWSDVQIGPLLVGALIFGLIRVATRVRIRAIGVYWLLGVAFWLALYAAGLDPAIAGLAIGLATPAMPLYSNAEFILRARFMLDRASTHTRDPTGYQEVNSGLGIEGDTAQLASVAKEAVSPAERVEASLYPWVVLGIVPVYMLANCGIDLTATSVSRTTVSMFTSILLGAGFIPILLMWLAVWLGAARLPGRHTWSEVLALPLMAGIAFPAASDAITLGIDGVEATRELQAGMLAASVVLGVLGYLLVQSDAASRRRAKEI